MKTRRGSTLSSVRWGLALAVALVMIFATPAFAAETKRVNVSGSFQPNNGAAFSSVSSATPVCWNQAGCTAGPRVAFITRATDQSGNGGNNGAVHVWVKFPEGNFELASRASKTQSGQGAQGNNDSSAADISANGRFVVFASNADNLVANDSNATTDIFRRNLETDKTQLVSRKSDQIVDGVRKKGAQAKGRSYLAAVSADGQKIVFVSEASNLGAQDANGTQPDVFFRNMKTGKTLTLSVTGQGEPTGNGRSGGNMGGGYMGGIAISGDGNTAAFGSGATDLSDADANGGYGDIFAVLNLDSTIQNTLQPHLVSSTKGVQGNFDGFTPALDYEGETLAYWSTSNNLVANDTNNTADIFVQDLFGQNVQRANVTNIGGEQDTGGARDVTVAINDAGNKISFTTYGMLQEGTCVQQPQVYVRDTSAQTTQRISVAYNGNCGDHWADYSDISADGKYVTFTSAATDLVPGDTNTFDDVFLRGML